VETQYRRTVAKALPTNMRTYFLFRSGRLSTNIKLTLYKALIRLVTAYARPIWEYSADEPLKIAAPAEQYSAMLEILTVHSSPRNASGFQNSSRV
jgi:hypothetical protein